MIDHARDLNFGELPNYDPLFCRNLSLSPDEWNTTIRPAVVPQAEVDKRTLLWTIQVVCIGRDTLIFTEANVVPISSSPTNGSVTPSPTCHFLIPTAMPFHSR